MNKKEEQNIIESFDLKAFGARLLKKWFLFLFAFIIASIVSFYQIRYSVPQYSAYSKVLLKDEYSAWTEESFIKGMELVSNRSRLSNEIGLLQSFSLNYRVVDALPFDVFYYKIGNIKTTELYKASPFKIVIDTTIHYQGVPTFFLKFKDKNHFHLSTKKDDIEAAKTYRVGQKISFPKVDFEIELTDEFISKDIDDVYAFKINDLYSLSKVKQVSFYAETDPAESSILKLSAGSPTIEKEIDYLNMLMRMYIYNGIEENNETSSSTLVFINEQLKEVADTLIKIENALEYFKLNINDEKLEINTTKLIPNSTEIEKQLIEAKFQKRYYESTLEFLKLNEDLDQVLIPPILGITIQDPVHRIISDLSELYARKAALRLSIIDSSLTFSKLLLQIEMKKNILIENLNSRLNKINFDIEQLSEELGLNESKLDRLPLAESESVRIQRIYKLNNDFYNYLLQKRSEASIAQASNIPKAKILEPASEYTVSYVGPFNANFYLLNFGLAFSLPFLLILILFLTSNKIIEKSDIENTTSIPIIGSIGHLNQPGNLVLANNPKSIVAESFRTIRTNINYLTKEKTSFCILITSSISGEGKTFCSINLAHAYAMSGKKTLLIGADLRRPKIFNDFNLKNDVGLSNYLISSVTFNEVIQATNFEHLHVVSSGPVPPNPSELIETDRMKMFVDEAIINYDVIIIDTPPIGLVSDAMILS